METSDTAKKLADLKRRLKGYEAELARVEEAGRIAARGRKLGSKLHQQEKTVLVAVIDGVKREIEHLSKS
jgi:hypothetical protein